MRPPFPSATPTWHNDTYDAISPTRPELSAAGKTVIITGAGSGIGRSTAQAFALAGASKLVLIGRTQSKLDETAASIPSPTTTTIHAISTTDSPALRATAASTGQWDILILGAAYTCAPSPLASASPTDWWRTFETNVQGAALAIQAFLPTANPAHACIVGITSGTVAMPAAMLPGLSAYISSKLAQTKLLEFVASEHENVFAATVHPGLVETGIFTKAGAEREKLPMDELRLPAHFLVWMCGPEAAFLKGRSVWANWDVGELVRQKETVLGGMGMTSGVNGWPYPYVG